MDAGHRVRDYFNVACIGGRPTNQYQPRGGVEFLRFPADKQRDNRSFQAENPGYTVMVVDNGATATLEANIIAGNTRGVDLFLAADTATPQDLLVNHFDLVTPYNNSSTPPLYTFNYAQGILALLTNIRGLDLSCETGTCGYNPDVFSTVAIADPSLAPYGVAAQSVLVGRYGVVPPDPRVVEYQRPGMEQAH